MLSVRLDERLVNAVEAIGRTERRGRSELVREALELWLKQRRTADQVREHAAGYGRHPVSEEEFGPVLGAPTWPK